MINIHGPKRKGGETGISVDPRIYVKNRDFYLFFGIAFLEWMFKGRGKSPELT